MSETLPLNDALLTLVFLLFVGTAVGGALIAVLTQWIIRSVCGLAMASVGLAGLFYFLHSPFLAMIHILIYIGAVCITIVFAIMLAEPDEPVDKGGRLRGAWSISAAVVCIGVFWGVGRLGLSDDWPAVVVEPSLGSVEKIGVALLTSHSFALEMLAIVLLVAILGALAVARKGRSLE